MLGWIYDTIVAVITFLLGLVGFDCKKRTVTFADDVKTDDESVKVEEVLTESKTE